MLPVDRQTITKKYKSAMALQATGKLSAAVTAYQELLKIVPHQPEVHFQLARIAKMRGEIALAADHINAALDQRPKEVELLKLSAEVNADAGHFNAAKAAHEQLVAAHPGDLKYAADLAHFLQLSGDTTGAETQLRRLIKKNPYQSELYRMLMTTLRVKPGDTLIGLMKKAISHPKMSDTGKMHLGFALAKAMEDLGRTDQVFRYLNLANDLQAKAFPYSTAQRDAEIDAILAAQADAPTECPASGAPTPILIAGMPRSGTTLVERILSGHPNVAAGGENPYGVKIIANMFGFGPGMRPLASLRKSELQTLAEAYRKTTAWRADQSKATHVTDKAITNYLLFGYLTAAMPSAKIIVVHRDPRDMALSIFKNHFQGGTHQYSNNLGQIADQIKRFQHAITTWKTRMPDRIFELHYEDLVSAPEKTARGLLDSAGLDWDPGCLHTDRKDGQIKTLSVAQARAPINTGSKAAWKKYEADMAPFLKAWDQD